VEGGSITLASSAPEDLENIIRAMFLDFTLYIFIFLVIFPFKFGRGF